MGDIHRSPFARSERDLGSQTLVDGEFRRLRVGSVRSLQERPESKWSVLSPLDSTPCSVEGALDLWPSGVAVRQTLRPGEWGGCNLLTPDSGDGGQKTGLGLALSC